jgi:hypothetical protein
MSGCAHNNDAVVSLPCVTVCSMYYSAVNLTMLQIISIHFGNVLIRVLVEDNRSGYNVSFDAAPKCVELFGIYAVNVCRI